MINPATRPGNAGRGVALFATTGDTLVDRGGTNRRILRTQHGRRGVVAGFTTTGDSNVGVELTAGPGCITRLVASVATSSGIADVVGDLAISRRVTTGVAAITFA